MHKHHIIPKSRGGSDDPWNFIDLEEREHAIKHAIDFVLFESAPWIYGATIRLLPDDLAAAVKAEMSRRMTIRNRAWVKSAETCRKIRDAQIGKPRYWYNNGERNMRVMHDQTPPEGWVRGRLNVPKECGNWDRGKRVWWTNGFETKWVANCPGEGWIRGRGKI